ncbi:hypothetical protein M8J76_013173 [Diaphorina citri]|nr:hypothetical protein M8J76_013173 [Diaphorina citri]
MNCYAFVPSTLYAFEFVLRKDAVQFFNSDAVKTFSKSETTISTTTTNSSTNASTNASSWNSYNNASYQTDLTKQPNQTVQTVTNDFPTSQGQGKSVQFWCKIRHPKCYDKSSPDFEPDTEIPKSADTVTVSAPSAAGSTAPAKTVKILKPDPSRDYTTDVNRAYYENMVLLKQVVFESEIYDQATFEKKFGLKFLPYAPNTAT